MKETQCPIVGQFQVLFAASVHISSRSSVRFWRKEPRSAAASCRFQLKVALWITISCKVSL